MLLRTWMRICGENQPSGVESIEIHISLTSKYECQVQLATYTAILFFCFHPQLGKEISHKLLSTEATFGFRLLC